MTFISAIIPNYNHANYLIPRIESVINQTYLNFEIIILDDASIDNSRKIIEQYRSHPKITNIVFNIENSGSPFKQWKKGIELAQGEWIWIAESDDIASLYFLEEIEQVIKENPAVNVIYCDSFLIDEKGEPYNKASVIKNNFFKVDKWCNSYCKPGVAELNENLKYLCTINNASAMVFKKTNCLSFMDEVSKFNYYGDWFFFLNSSYKSSIFYLNKPLSSYRNHANNHVNTRTLISKTKKEHFTILIFLLKHPHVYDKDKLIDFFVLHYLGFGLYHDGPIEGAKIFKQYFSVNRKLTICILGKFIYNKIIGHKNRKEYI